MMASLYSREELVATTFNTYAREPWNVGARASDKIHNQLAEFPLRRIRMPYAWFQSQARP